MLPTTYDRDRVNGCAKSRHGISNGGNDGRLAKPSDAVTEKGSEN